MMAVTGAALCCIPSLCAAQSAEPQGPAAIDVIARLKEQGAVSVRAVADLPSPKMVRYIALSARKLAIGGEGAQALKGQTPRQVIEQACGSLQPGYAEVFAEQNLPRILPLDEAIGDEPEKVVFPACLYARKLDGEAINADNQTKPAAYATTSTLLIPKMSQKFFEQGLNTVGKATVSAPEEGGRIIGPVDSDCAGGEALGGSVPNIDQVRASYPFHPTAVRAAYARTLGADQPDKIFVMVLDNGFWGVPCVSTGCPNRDAKGRLAFNDPFPKTFFATDLYRGEIGPTLFNRFAPVNYSNGLRPDMATPSSAHGTHVTGLIFGGAAAGDSGWRTIFGATGASWLKLTVGNLAPGALTFPRDTIEPMELLLSRGDLPDQKVVNLSLALIKSHAAYMEQLVGRWGDTLFVAAAGNDGNPVELDGLYPAALGGMKNGNVLSVASVDGDGRLSGFSNYSNDLVDLAAPGCKIASWLTLDRTEAVSGTSQAAPLVTFTAAALHSLWPGATPKAVKNRLAYSGVLLAKTEDRARIRSQTRLDPFQALLLRDDVVRARNPDRLLLGTLSPLQGLHCTGKPAAKWDDVRAFKREDAARLYTSAVDAAMPCDAVLDDQIAGVANRVFMEVRAVFQDGVFTAPAKADEDFPVADLVDFVRAELAD